jgi:hypothetical protein
MTTLNKIMIKLPQLIEDLVKNNGLPSTGFEDSPKSIIRQGTLDRMAVLQNVPT